MTPEQWDRIQEVYHQLSELAEAERGAALEELCAGDEVVRSEVLELLRNSMTSDLGDVVRQVAFDAAGQGQQRVGPYRMERALGRGGMGTVYLAVRDDQQFQRQVAVKFLNLGMDRPEYLRRFRQERQILADLEHPNIARLLDGGQSSEGLPYLVMEYVEGQPLLAYCRDRELGRQSRIELLVKVCDAVQYAHSKLVVHRDLKPSNILVTPDGEPKLLDFGIAKVLPGGSGPMAPETRATDQLLTVDYASPEQLLGEPVSTVSDIYALGVILYELLTGRRPFESPTVGTLVYRILHETPQRPSLKAREVGLPALPAELDNVILKAMAREPQRRYQSAQALAEDLRRYLKGKPVLAHGDGAWYVASKFILRHRVQSAVAALFVLTLVGMGIQLAVANARLAQERDKAIRERSNAREVSNFMVELFGNAEKQPNPGQEITAREILDMGAKSLLAREVTDPELRANLQIGIGGAYQRMGRWQEARTHLEEAMQLLRGLGDDAIDVRLDALTEHANVMERLGELATSEASARELVEVCRQHRPRRLPLALSALANTVSNQGRNWEAERLYREGLSLESPEGDGYIPLKANWSIALFRVGKFEESYRNAMEVKELLRTRWQNLPKAQAFPLDTQANLECLRGNYRESLRVFGELTEVLLRYGGPEDPMLGYSACGQAEVHLAMRDVEAAAAPLAQCAEIRARTVKPTSHHAIRALELRGLNQLLSGQPQEAEATFRTASKVLLETYGEGHGSRIKSLRLLGMALAAQNRMTEAEQQFSDAITLWQKNGGHEDPEYAELMLHAGVAARRAGNFQEAEKRLRTVLRIREEMRFAPLSIHQAAVELAACLHAARNDAEARKLVEAALLHYRANPPEIRGQLEAAEALFAKLATMP